MKVLTFCLLFTLTSASRTIKSFPSKAKIGSIVENQRWPLVFRKHAAIAKTYSDRNRVAKFVENFEYLQTRMSSSDGESINLKAMSVVLSHPINCYQYIYTFVKILDSIRDNPDVAAILESGAPVLTISDLHTAGQAILRLQRTYNISAAEFYAGNISGHHGSILTEEEAETIATVAGAGDPARMERWLHLAYYSEANSPMHNARNLIKLARIQFENHNKEDGLEALVHATNMDQTPEVVQQAHELIREFLPPGQKRLPQILPDLGGHLEELCRTKQTTRPIMSCHYRPAIVTYNMFREELVWNDPVIRILHDIIPESERSNIVDAAYYQLRNIYYNNAAKGLYDRFDRLVVLPTSGDRTLENLQSRLLFLSEIQPGYITPSNTTKIMNFPLGLLSPIGAKPKSNSTPRRQELWTIQLKNVIKGGSIIFPELDLKVDLKARSALVWQTHNELGEFISRGQHKHCPVLLGDKWVIQQQL